MRLDVTIIADTASFRALEPAWNALHERGGKPHFYLSFDWQWHAWNSCASERGHKLRIVLVRADGHVVLIWPLVLADPSLEFVASDKFEYRDVIAENSGSVDAWLDAALATARGLGASSMLLRDIRADSTIAAYLARRGLGRQIASSRAWILDLGRFGTWEDYTATLPKSLLANQKVKWRRLARLPDGVQFTQAKDADEVRAAVRWLIDQKVAWLNRKGEPSHVFGSPAHRRFLENVSLSALEHDHLFLAMLKSGRELLSVLLGFCYDREFIFHQFVYDPKWSAFSPGRLIFERTIAWCQERGISVFDMLEGDEPYKATWGGRPVPVETYNIPCLFRVCCWRSGIP